MNSTTRKRAQCVVMIMFFFSANQAKTILLNKKGENLGKLEK